MYVCAPLPKPAVGQQEEQLEGENKGDDHRRTEEHRRIAVTPSYLISADALANSIPLRVGLCSFSRVLGTRPLQLWVIPPPTRDGPQH